MLRFVQVVREIEMDWQCVDHVLCPQRRIRADRMTL